MAQKLLILGIRGVPAKHGGFETFAEFFSVYLKNEGWEVTVYCQEEGQGEMYTSEWQGVKRIHVPVKGDNVFSTILFDCKSVWHASRQEGVVLTLGYNTGILSILYLLFGKRNVINMDGVEWRREKWSTFQKFWLYCNEWLAARMGSHLIADHPEIKNHLMRHTAAKKITVIPYGAEDISSADASPLTQYDLTPGGYAIIIARAEPENSILEVVRAYSELSLDFSLVVLGKYELDSNAYHREVVEAASENVIFLGAIYEKETVQSLRHHARVYLHGHTVGGTNPSLVEAMGAGNAVIAHDNDFNRWVLGEGGIYFDGHKSLCQALISCTDREQLKLQSKAVKKRFLSEFRLEVIHQAYMRVLNSLAGR